MTDEKKAQIKAAAQTRVRVCVQKLQAKGRRYCAGCTDDLYCPIYGEE